MAYKRSVFRAEYEKRVLSLRDRARLAQRLPQNYSDQNLADVRDMVFQCAIFQTSAAIETYLKLIIESWAHEMRRQARGSFLPADMRATFVRKRLEPLFKKFAYQDEEIALHHAIKSEAELWLFLNGGQNIPAFFDGRVIHEACAYPSYKNLKRLFNRIGVSDFEARMDRALRRDVEGLVLAFQEIRTALAHSSPPRITLKDVRDRLDEQIKLVSAIDRILYNHIMLHGGPTCWSEAI